MFKLIETNSTDIVAIEISGEIGRQDYLDTLVPLFENYSESSGLRLLVLFAQDFKGFSAGAVLEDLKLGHKLLGKLDRIAVVCSRKWINHLYSFFGGFIPVAFRLFNNADNAMAWLNSGEINLDFQLDTQKGILSLSLHDKIDTIMFQELTPIFDSYIETHGFLGSLKINVDDFHGWNNIGSLISHFVFVKSHLPHIKRVAIVGNKILPELISSLVNHFTSSEIMQFDTNERAQQWLIS